jgi:hypothetical protein
MLFSDKRYNEGDSIFISSSASGQLGEDREILTADDTDGSDARILVFKSVKSASSAVN